MKVPYLFILRQNVSDSATELNTRTRESHRAAMIQYFVNAIVHIKELETNWFSTPEQTPYFTPSLEAIYNQKLKLLEDPQIKHWTSTSKRFHNLINYLFILSRCVPKSSGIDGMGVSNGLSDWYRRHLVPLLTERDQGLSSFEQPTPYFGPTCYYNGDTFVAHGTHLSAAIGNPELLFLDLG